MSRGMMELFELAGITATLVAAYQGSLLQALLNDHKTSVTYAEELGLNPRATKHILDILVSMGIADCNEGRYGASVALKNLDDVGPGGIAHDMRNEIVEELVWAHRDEW